MITTACTAEKGMTPLENWQIQAENDLETGKLLLTLLKLALNFSKVL